MSADEVTITNALVQPSNVFPPILNDAIEDCARARSLFVDIKNENEQNNIDVTSPVASFCNIGVHLSESLEGSINTIGYTNNVLNRLGNMLNPEQLNLFADDLRGMRDGVLKTYRACQAAAHVLVDGLRQRLVDDPRLCNDSISFRCIANIEERSHALLALPATSESIRERSLTVESIHSELDRLTDRVQTLSPDGPFSKFLQTFSKAMDAIVHILKAIQAMLTTSVVL